MSTPEEVISVLCPQLLTVSGYTVYLDIAESMTSSGFFKDKYEYAVALRAAHLYTLNTGRKGQAGVETYLMEGRLAKSYGGFGVIRDNLELTGYGMQLKGLIFSMNAPVTVGSTYIFDTLGGESL